MIVLLLLAYRRIGSVVVERCCRSQAPALAGLAAVSALFGNVHGITLAFGFTLIGVAQDYPIHLLSHRRPDRCAARGRARAVADACDRRCKHVHRVLDIPVLAACSASRSSRASRWRASPSPGLTTRFCCRCLIGARHAITATPRLLRRLSDAIAALAAPPWAGCGRRRRRRVASSLAPQPFWENDLGGLTPVPADLLAQDRELRAQLGTRRLALFARRSRAADEQAALRSSKCSTRRCRSLVRRGAIAATITPRATCRRRRRSARARPACPMRRHCAAIWKRRKRRRRFAPAPSSRSSMTSRGLATLAPLTIEQIRAHGARHADRNVAAASRTAAVTALVTLSGVTDVAALRELARVAGGATTLLDLKDASESLVARQRTRILWTLAVAAVLLVAVVAFALRSRARVSAGDRADGAYDARDRRGAASGRSVAQPIPLDLADARGRAGARLRAVLRACGGRRRRSKRERCTRRSFARYRLCSCSRCSRRRACRCCGRSALRSRSASSRTSCSRCC